MFQEEALIQMQNLPYKKSDKKIIASEMFVSLRSFMTENELLNVWFSKNIKWDKNAEKLLSQASN